MRNEFGSEMVVPDIRQASGGAFGGGLGGALGGGGAAEGGDQVLSMTPEQEEVGHALVEMITQYVKASPGDCSSRDVGRYLQVQQVKSKAVIPNETALQVMKRLFGSLKVSDVVTWRRGDVVTW